MKGQPTDPAVIQRALDLHASGMAVPRIASALGISDSNVYRWLKQAGVPANSGRPENPDTGAIDQLKMTIASLRAALTSQTRDALTENMIRSRIVGLGEGVARLDPVEWLLAPRKASSPGVPTLVLSDFHWGEVVKPEQINGTNEYNIGIAHRRLKSTIGSAIELLRIVSPELNYPGIVVPLGGDIISGNIHEELSVTNEMNTMPTVIDVWGALVSAILTLLEHFPYVFLPCVTGNHGRDTKKIWHKDRHATSFDWLIYTFLAKRFEAEPRVRFYIPDGLDAHYQIYNYRYKLEHGDQLGKGGDGIIGALGPIIRGDHKKRSRDAAIDLAYDTMIIGHWHQYIHMQRVIVNGSLKGYDEYANAWGFGFEPAQQALWITHPRHGMTYRMPVYAERGTSKIDPAEWVSVFGGRG